LGRSQKPTERKIEIPTSQKRTKGRGTATIGGESLHASSLGMPKLKGKQLLISKGMNRKGSDGGSGRSKFKGIIKGTSIVEDSDGYMVGSRQTEGRVIELDNEHPSMVTQKAIARTRCQRLTKGLLVEYNETALERRWSRYHEKTTLLVLTR